MVIITTADGKSILMAHMKERSKLKVGASIKKGDAVGIMGNTGNSFGAHLHIEVQNYLSRDHYSREDWDS